MSPTSTSTAFCKNTATPRRAALAAPDASAEDRDARAPPRARAQGPAGTRPEGRRDEGGADRSAARGRGRCVHDEHAGRQRAPRVLWLAQWNRPAARSCARRPRPRRRVWATVGRR